MPPAEEPYHYLQKKIGAIVSELTTELIENTAEFKRISKEAYDIEELILLSRSKYMKVSQEIQAESKRQQEIEGVLDYFEGEIDKIRTILQANPIDGPETPTFASLGDLDSLVSEFNSLVATLDLSIPNSINIFLNENMNLISYADTLIQKLATKRALAKQKLA
ncbi:hypothetical protein NEHOM01_1637 [Nematocida homosporus]|uniref:uncharacterized protein n=1 Tax=Nematocida homosporus TaxID=1912981 RepID=UPI0022208265|nr:uncharacterized protein NEHOM01_1637 [Nematocida homosporus]KAI5186684.1 hypothetical protein NEHOM01_1637 [Nematocida homosporus]